MSVVLQLCNPGNEDMSMLNFDEQSFPRIQSCAIGLRKRFETVIASCLSATPSCPAPPQETHCSQGYFRTSQPDRMMIAAPSSVYSSNGVAKRNTP